MYWSRLCAGAIHVCVSSVILYSGEGQDPVSITFSELRKRVCVLASALRGCGVRRGDRVVGYLPNSFLAVEAMLATASLGAVWSSTSPDFGVTVSAIKFSIFFCCFCIRKLMMFIHQGTA